MKSLLKANAALLAGALLAPVFAHAALALDTGTPTSLANALVLDGNDFYAAEFNLATTSSIDSLSAYMLAGMDSPGATFTMAIYADPITSRWATPDYSVQASYGSDGWNTVQTSAMNFVEAAGNYWVALEVGNSDSAIGLGLPTGATSGGTVAASAYAFNSGGGYTTAGATAFGVQVQVTPVPEPGSLWLLASGLAVVGAFARRRAAAQA